MIDDEDVDRAFRRFELQTELLLQRTRPRVLLIDDNVTQLDLYAMVLEHDGFRVLRATRAESGYERACRELPDAIVIDVLLPDGDGLELAKRLRTNPVTTLIPQIVLTGDDHAYTRAQLLRHDLAGIFMKPCPADRLVTTLTRPVANR